MKFCPQCSEFFPNEATFCPSDGKELKRTHDPYLGRTIASRYRLTKRLGSGGMSTVYLAHHVMIERKSAIKILRDDLSSNPTHRERFLREARAVNRINHPNIVEISDLGEADGVAYLVMEYIDGPSLHQALTSGPLPWQRAVRIAIQVSAALARAHQMGVIHRDLKPENILLAPALKEPLGMVPYPLPLHSEEDLVKLTDFGIAKIADAPALTFAEQLFGTPGYIAPEYIEGLASEPRSDIYSLGVILYEMTTGRLPYDARGAALLSMPLREPPIPPSRRLAGYHPELEELVLQLLARRPDDRPADAFLVYDALVNLLRVPSIAAAAPDGTPDGPSIVSSGFDATRISYPAQGEVREDAQTMVEEVHNVSPSALYTRQTTDLAEAEAAGTVRFHEAVAEIDTEIAAARRLRVDSARTERANELVNGARGKLRLLERVSRAVRVQQGRVDGLEADARQISRGYRPCNRPTRPRPVARTGAREAVRRRLGTTSASVPPSERRADVQLWETAALGVEADKADRTDDDLTFRIDSLQKSLDGRNAALEEDVISASGELEGSLSALRHLTHEIVKTLEEASGQLKERPEAEPETRLRE